MTTRGIDCVGHRTAPKAVEDGLLAVPSGAFNRQAQLFVKCFSINVWTARSFKLASLLVGSKMYSYGLQSPFSRVFSGFNFPVRLKSGKR